MAKLYGDEMRLRLDAEEALIRCAVISGEDGEAVDAARSGAMKHPSLADWAIGCVSQLRADYDAALGSVGVGDKG